MNLADEEGLPNGESHPALWLDFCESLSLNAGAVKDRSAPIGAAALALEKGYFEITSRSYAEGLGALYAYEYQIPEISVSKIEGLERQYDLKDEKATAFFQVHQTADQYHSEACRTALDQLNPTDQALATKGALEASKLLWKFLDESYASA
jgi:pyrroloquinoline-quinone synthase